jgi:hypothetical protein
LRQSGEDADHRGLAGAVGAEQTEEFAFLDIQAHRFEGLKIPLGVR